MGTRDNRMEGKVFSPLKPELFLIKSHLLPLHKFMLGIPELALLQEPLEFSAPVVTMRAGFESKHIFFSLKSCAQLKCARLLCGSHVLACCSAALWAAISALWMWKTVCGCAGATFWLSPTLGTWMSASRSWTASSTQMKPWLRLAELVWENKYFYALVLTVVICRLCNDFFVCARVLAKDLMNQCIFMKLIESNH